MVDWYISSCFRIRLLIIIEPVSFRGTFQIVFWFAAAPPSLFHPAIGLATAAKNFTDSTIVSGKIEHVKNTLS
jgi:hypothetical protein